MNLYNSNIFWHFTGSPENLNWEEITCPNDILKSGKPKSDTRCLRILGKILESGFLKASSHEKIYKDLKTEKFCCVTDIPIQNLHEHRKYYGNVAIGFKHHRIQKEFNPVFYISKKLIPFKLRNLDDLSEIERNRLGLKKSLFRNSKMGIFTKISKLGFKVDNEKLGSYLYHHFKITSFSDNPGDSFYREREWRKLGDFRFVKGDIAVIIVPERILEKCRILLSKYSLNHTPILTWELIGDL